MSIIHAFRMWLCLYVYTRIHSDMMLWFVIMIFTFMFSTYMHMYVHIFMLRLSSLQNMFIKMFIAMYIIYVCICIWVFNIYFSPILYFPLPTHFILRKFSVKIFVRNYFMWRGACARVYVCTCECEREFNYCLHYVLLADGYFFAIFLMKRQEIMAHILYE